MARKRKRKAGSLDEVRVQLFDALLRVKELMASDDPPTVIKAAHAVSQLSGSYIRAVEASELEGRIQALEQRAT